MIKKPNTIVIVLVCLFVAAEILILKPAKIENGEEPTTTGMFNSIDSMVEAQKSNDEVGYTIDGFHYTAVEGEIKHWELNANQAILYEKSRLVHAQNAHIKMFDPNGKITYIDGDIADYKMGIRDLELIGHVKVTFPDQFWLKTTRAHYTGATGKINSDEPMYGETSPPSNKPGDKKVEMVSASSASGASGDSGAPPVQVKTGELMQMWGIGFDASKLDADVYIHNKAHVRLRRLEDDEITDVVSDKAHIDRFKKFAYFTMAAPDRFVESHQGTLYVRSRRQDGTYDSDASVLKYMTAYDDVLIRETDPVKLKGGLQYATSEKAEFLTQEDKIILSGFPSAYQEHDTLTGELIIIYRKKNLVEVSETNAFHDGTAQQQQQRRQQEQQQQQH